MRARWLAAAAGAAAITAVAVAQAGAGPLTAADVGTPRGAFRFCAEAQVDVAKIDRAALAAAGLSVGGRWFSDYNDFIASKSAADPAAGEIVTTQYVEYRDAGRTQPKQYRCKFRTGESLNEGAWPAGSENQADPRFQVPPYFGFGPAGGTRSHHV